MLSQSVVVNDWYIRIDMVNWISKNYSWINNPQVLYDIIYKHYKKNSNQKVIFEFTDGENLFFSGAAEFIKYCQSSLQIPKEHLHVKSHNICELDYATHIPLRSGFLSMHFNHEIRNQEFDKKFLSLSGRFDINRLRLTMHLHNRWKDDSIISYFLHPGHVKHNLKNCESYFQNEIAWVEANAPIWIDGINSLEDRSKSTVPWVDSMHELSNYYHRYFIDIVAETDTWNPRWITEKTIRSFVFGKPFILYNGCGSLEYIKELGFQTFSPWINESYDQVENPIERLAAVMSEIDRLGALDYPTLKQMAVEMQPIFEHNRARQQQFQSPQPTELEFE